MARLRIDERIISRCLNHVTPIKASITSKAYVRETFAEDQAMAFKAWAAHVGKVVGVTECVIEPRHGASIRATIGLRGVDGVKNGT